MIQSTEKAPADCLAGGPVPLAEQTNRLVASATRPGRRHLEVLALCCAVVFAAWALEVLPDEQHIAVRGLTAYPLPHVCASRIWLGLKCPACGLTRSIIYLAHADWQASFRAHRLGWLVAALIASQIPYRLLAWRRRHRRVFEARVWTIVVGAIVVLLVANWLFEAARGRVATAPTLRAGSWF